MTGGLQPGQPDRDRRAPVDGQELPGHQHRRERRDQPRQAGRAVQPRDVRDRARAALHRLAGERRAARTSARAACPRRPGRRSSRRSSRLRGAPLWVDDSGDIGMLEIRAKARRLYSQKPGGPRPRDRRLPAAAARRVAQREPRRDHRADVARAEDARPRARRAGRSRSRSSTAASSRATRRSRCSRTCASRAPSSRTPTS